MAADHCYAVIKVVTRVFLVVARVLLCCYCSVISAFYCVVMWSRWCCDGCQGIAMQLSRWLPKCSKWLLGCFYAVTVVF